MIYKRATKRLLNSGIEDIQIVRGLWGAAPENVMYERQHTRCFPSADEAATAVIDGFRPTRTTNHLG